MCTLNTSGNWMLPRCPQSPARQRSLELCGSERWGPHVLVALLCWQPVCRIQEPASGHVAAGMTRSGPLTLTTDTWNHFSKHAICCVHIFQCVCPLTSSRDSLSQVIVCSELCLFVFLSHLHLCYLEAALRCCSTHFYTSRSGMDVYNLWLSRSSGSTVWTWRLV